MANLYGTPYFTPHGFCLAWDPPLLWLHVVSDAAIALSYYSIPLALTYFVLRRRDLVFGWVFLLFATFILACGSTHLMDIWTLWHADYRAQGLLKALTAIVSVLTAALLWPLIPKALMLPSPQTLRVANERLVEEVRQKENAVCALQRETAEREHTEAMLRQAQKMEAIGQLTGGVAHDFNNLLMVIQGSLECLRESGHFDAEAEKYTARALRSVQQGSALTGQLLAFARRQPLQPSTFDLNDRVRGMVDLLGGTLGSPVRLTLDLAGELWAINADPNQVDAALLNLAINARDAMPRGGALVIRTHNLALDGARSVERPDLNQDMEPGEYVAISVADTGMGMTEHDAALAFEPFFTTKPIGKGSGLGLSQIYGFVRQSGGYVNLTSALDQGTTITLLLPRATTASPKLLEPASA